MDDKIKKGFFTQFGESIDRSFQEGADDIREGRNKIAEGVRGILDALGDDEQEQKSNDPNMVIINLLSQRMNKIGEPVDSDFSYSTILRWVKSNAKGNRFYLLKHAPNDGKLSYIFVFFGKDKNVMLEESDPQICFICKRIPESIESLFGNKQVFIQPFE
mgnify:CR=1 FL=1